MPLPAKEARTVYVPALVGAVVVPVPAAPAVEPLKYSNVAAGDRFVSPPTPFTVAEAGCVLELYVCGVAQVISTEAAALPITIVLVAEAGS